jgi:hypothetical protein
VAGLIQRLGAIELTGNHRQGATWERTALAELRHGNPVWGLASFELADRIHRAPSMAEARAELVDAWLAARSAGADSVMLAVTRDDVTALNQLARAALRRAGDLGSDQVNLGGVGLAIGDQVICLRNDSVLEVVNGTKGTVRSVTDEGIAVTTDQGLRQLPFGYAVDGHLDHGYATTIHKSQGQTVDRAFVLATDSLTREAGYVAMSRARKGTDLFVPVSAFEDGITPDQREQTNPMHGVAKRFLVSRAKGMATDELPEPYGAGRTPLVDTRVASDPADAELADTGLADTDLAGSVLAPSESVSSQSSPPADESEDRYLVDMLGRRPAFLAERSDYDRVARAVSSYRTTYGIDRDGAEQGGVGTRAPLGAPPLEAFQRSEFEKVLTQVRTYQRRLGLDLGLEGPSRGMSR